MGLGNSLEYGSHRHEFADLAVDLPHYTGKRTHCQEKHALPGDDYHLPPRAYRQRYHQGRPLPSKAMRDACTWPSTTETAARARRLPKLDPPDVADCDPERVNRKQNIRGVPPTFLPPGMQLTAHVFGEERQGARQSALGVNRVSCPHPKDRSARKSSPPSREISERAPLTMIARDA